jgi:AcrR family transcriptional regulator
MLPTPHPDDAAVRRRPGGRSAQVRRTVLDAALAELSAVGYAAFTIDGVARRSGVHKTTIYRRWNGPGQLVADAIISYADAAAPIPDTGAIEDDLRHLAGSVAAQMSADPGRALLATIFSDAIRIPAVNEIKKAFFAERIRQAEGFVSRAVARGELPDGTQAASMIETLMAPLYYRFLVTAQPVDRNLVDRLVAQCVVAARADAFIAPSDPQRRREQRKRR